MFACMWLTNEWQSYGPYEYNVHVGLSCGELYHKNDKGCGHETAWADSSYDGGPTTHFGQYYEASQVQRAMQHGKCNYVAAILLAESMLHNRVHLGVFESFTSLAS